MGLRELIVLFIVTYFAVRLAINPLLNRKKESITDTHSSEIIKLRDMEILDNAELEEVIKLYQNRMDKKKEYEQYEKHAKILNELKEMGYFTNIQYLNKIHELKSYFKVD
ncbi:hypothetical protein [Clostridium sp.]|uniref:hypothetical protein n=1 Tax=Clostridium sp. TaxID=1506 RepID=UPI002FC6B6D2